MTNEKQTLEQRLIEVASAEGLTKKELSARIQQKLVEIAKLSLDHTEAINAAKLLETKIDESSVQQIYSHLSQTRSTNKLTPENSWQYNHTYLAPIKKFYEATDVVPAFEPAELKELVIRESLPISVAVSGLHSNVFDSEFYDKYLKSLFKREGFYDDEKEALKIVKTKRPEEFAKARDNLLEEAVRDKDISLLSRIGQQLPEVKFEKYTPQIEEILTTTLCKGEMDEFESISKITKVKVKEDPRIQERYEEIFTKGEAYRFRAIKNVQKLSGIPIKRTPQIEKIINEKIIPGSFYDYSGLVDELKDIGLEVSEKELTEYFYKEISKQLVIPSFDKKYNSKEGYSPLYWLNRVLEPSKKLKIVLTPKLAEDISSQLYRTNPQEAESIAKGTKINLDEKRVQDSIVEQLKDGKIDLAIGWAEYFCVRPKLSDEQLSNLGKVAIAKATASDYGKIEILDKVKDLAELAEKKVNYDSASIERLFESAIDQRSSSESPANLRKYLGVEYSPKILELLQKKVLKSLLDEKLNGRELRPLYTHDLEHIEAWSGIPVSEKTIRAIYDKQLEIGNYGDIVYSVKECSKENPRLQMGLEHIIEWIQSPTKDQITEQKSARLAKEKQRELEHQEELRRRESLPKYSLSQQSKNYKVDITVPLNSENKFVYAKTKEGLELVYARPLYDCGYHRDIAALIQKEHGELTEIRGGWIKAGNSGLEIYGSSESFGTAPMNHIRELLSKREVSKK